MSLNRRTFVKASLGALPLVSLGTQAPSLFTRAAMAAASGPHDRETILVVVQLAGGNDGLNTVVPYADDVYGRSRTTLRLPAKELHKLDAYAGLHPKLRAFKQLYDQGRLGIVQGVGYPSPNRSHGGGMGIWHTAKIDWANCPTGWVGRAVEQIHRPGDLRVPALFVGNLETPLTLQGERTVTPSIRSPGECLLSGLPGGGQAQRQRQTTAALGATDDSLLAFVRGGVKAAHARSNQIQAALQQATSGASAGYPPYQLAAMFRSIAQLIRADVGIRIFCTELGGPEPGGFDNHAGQLGNHAALLEQLAASVGAFVDDLARDRLLDRVVLVTFSEFGRTIRENGRRGTDHGTAAPMFLAGGAVRPGLIGAHPSLTDLDGGEMKVLTDFRRVYATLLDGWLGIDSRAVLGERFEPVELLRA